MEPAYPTSLRAARRTQLGPTNLANRYLGYENQAEAETAFRREIARLLEIGSDNLVADVPNR
jgi:hypothetical protein